MVRRKVQQSEGKGAPGWMTTYGDMVTLLLTFFIMLYSFSSIDSDKWQNLVTSFTGGAGVLDGMAVQSEYEELQRQLQEFQRLYQKLGEYIEENDLSAKVQLSKTDNEIQIHFVDNVLFDSGKASLKQEAMEILARISLVFHSYEESIQMIRIEGHTDHIAIHTAEFPTNWELSTKRAVEVLRFLIEQQNLSPVQLSAVGYGEYHPIADNMTAEGRAKNRRVDFVIARTMAES